MNESNVVFHWADFIILNPIKSYMQKQVNIFKLWNTGSYADFITNYVLMFCRYDA